MKKVIFWLCFVLVIFLPTAGHAKDLHPVSHARVEKAEPGFQNFQAIADSILFDDLVEDEPDDNIPGTERKRHSAPGVQPDNSSLLADSYSNSLLRRASYTGNFFISHTTRNIYYSVFRL